MVVASKVNLSPPPQKKKEGDEGARGHLAACGGGCPALCGNFTFRFPLVFQQVMSQFLFGDIEAPVLPRKGF